MIVARRVRAVPAHPRPGAGAAGVRTGRPAAGRAAGIALAVGVAFAAGPFPSRGAAQPAPAPVPTQAPSATPAPASAPAPASPPLPGFAELEAAGARVGRIRVRTLNVFDTDDPAESLAPYRWANALHPTTRPETILRSLPFASGEPLTASVMDEAERVLRATRLFHDVALRPVAVRDGVVDVEVVTRDTWTLYPGIGISRSGGATSSSLSIREYNLAGTGTAIALGRADDPDRVSTLFEVSNGRLPGDLAVVGTYAHNSDGSRQALRVEHPFHTLDTRWAAGASFSLDDRVDPVYDAGEVVARYRHTQDRAEAWVGRSTGRVDGRVQRWSVGVSAREDTYATEPGETPPAELNPDETLVGPFVRWQLIEDRFGRSGNLDQMGRPEFLALGLASTVQIGYAARAFGSTGNAWLYSASVSRGVETAPRQVLLASAVLSGRLVGGEIERQTLGGRMQYYLPQGTRWLLYGSLAADLLTRPAPLDELTLGGDNGLRGYPLRYQSGTRRVLLTVEERLFTDAYWLRLFRLGAAAFVDVGRAWGTDAPTRGDPGWLVNVGVGLRIFSVRASLGQVVHLDLAFPLDGDPSIERVQFLVRGKASF